MNARRFFRTTAADFRARGNREPAWGKFRRTECDGYPGKRGFTLLEMMITVSVFLILAVMIFDLMSGVLQGASTLQDNQNHSDEISSLYTFLKNKLTLMPARSTLASYARGDGEGLIQNGIIFGNTNLATAIDAKIQPNSLYLLRLTSFATDASAQQPQDARQVLMQSVTTDDPTLVWTPLIKDVKTLDWKFQDAALVQWDDHLDGQRHAQFDRIHPAGPGPDAIDHDGFLGAENQPGLRAHSGESEPNRRQIEPVADTDANPSPAPATRTKPESMKLPKGRRTKAEGRRTELSSAATSPFYLHPSSFQSRRGSALLIVLWALLLLGMAVFGVVEIVELSIDHASYRRAPSTPAGWRFPASPSASIRNC